MSELVATHDAMIQEEISRYHGESISHSLGGYLVSFNGPARAIRCADAIARKSRELGLSIRVGLHAGECQRIGNELSGVALQTVERICNRAGSNEILASSTIRDLVAGSGIEFDEIPGRMLTGPSSSLTLFRLATGSDDRIAPPPTLPLGEELMRPPGVLSPREREVALLVARGYSNRDIADRLSIAPSTVERHVANILGKLGFHSRAQVAAWAVAHDLLRIQPV